MAGEKSRYQIRMDYKKAQDQADKLDEAAKCIRQEGNRFHSCRVDIKHAWEGDNAKKFTAKMGMVSEDLEKIAKQLEKTADAIRKSAKNIYQAEMEAKRLADIRNHS